MRIALTLLAIGSIVFAFWQAALGHVAVTGLAVLAAFGLLFFANLDRISEIKLSKRGFEAKTRERITKAESDIADLKDLTEQIRREIDSTPYFIHGRLPFVGQAILRYLYQGKRLAIDDFCQEMSHISSREEIENVVSELRDKHGWINVHDGTITFTKKGEEAVKSYMELTIVRFF